MKSYLYYSQIMADQEYGGYIRYIPTDTNYTLVSKSPNGVNDLKDKFPDIKLVNTIEDFDHYDTDFSHKIIDWRG
jgi:hypothetical protein